MEQSSSKNIKNGQLKECIYLPTDEKRSVKILEKNQLSDRDLELCMNEVNILHGINHPNLLNIKETFSDN